MTDLPRVRFLVPHDPVKCNSHKSERDVSHQHATGTRANTRDCDAKLVLGYWSLLSTAQ